MPLTKILQGDYTLSRNYHQIKLPFYKGLKMEEDKTKSLIIFAMGKNIWCLLKYPKM